MDWEKEAPKYDKRGRKFARRVTDIITASSWYKEGFVFRNIKIILKMTFLMLLWMLFFLIFVFIVVVVFDFVFYGFTVCCCF